MLKFKGSCDGCPSSGETLKYGIENLLKHYFPQIETIEVMNNDIEHLNHKEYEEFIRKLRDKNNDENNGC
ncbi:MAG: NFU1 iron-sulfur cluster scaffold [Marteilia pararefringens]